MRIDRFIVRVVLVGIVCAVGTVWLGWLSVPFIGLLYGLLEWRVRVRGSIAAIGAALAWAGLLGAELARGADIRLVADQIGAVMNLPGVVLVAATFAFGAILAGTAAVLGAGIGGAIRLSLGGR